MTHDEASGDASAGVLRSVLQFNEGRKRKFVRLKLRRMLEGPFTFFRATNHLFVAHWSELQPPDLGPDILICGDLHLENFGAYQTADGDFRYDINDFDESMVAPATIDLVRCTTSVFLAAEEWRLKPSQAASMALAYLEHYRKSILAAARAGAAGEIAPRSGHGAIWELLGSTALGTQKTLLERNIDQKSSGTCRLRAIDNHPRISRKRFELIREALNAYGQKAEAPQTYEIHDIRGRIAGVGSLGVRRYLALLEGEGPPDGYRLLDIKQAEPSAIAPITSAPQPDFGGNEARRVVAAQTQLQGHPSAGLDTLSIDETDYRIREMIPDENRSSLDRFRKQPAKLREAVETAGQLTAWSHLRGCRIAPDQDTAERRQRALASWSAGAGVDAVLAAAARYGERTNQDYAEFRRAVRDAGGPARCLEGQGEMSRLAASSPGIPVS